MWWHSQALGLGLGGLPLSPPPPSCLRPHHRVPSAPVSLSGERIQFMHKPWEQLAVTALSFISNACQDFVRSLTPTWPPNPSTVILNHSSSCTGIMTSTVLFCHQPQECRGRGSGDQLPCNCKHLSTTTHSSLAASISCSFYTES